MIALEKPSYLRAFENFLYKPVYMVLCAALTIFANCFGAELFVYTCFTLIVLYLCILGRDLLPILPLIVCAYIAPSRSNNPGLSNESVFSSAQGGTYMMVLATVMVLALIYRLIRDPELGRAAFFKCKRTLLPGMAALGIAYLLSGVGSAYWFEVGWKNQFFGFVQAASLLVPYVILTAMVKWEEAPTGYLAWTGMCIGYTLLAELLIIYLRYNVIQGNHIDRLLIYSGWGHYNNIGTLLAIMIPFPFFLTGKGKHSGIFYISGMLFLAGVLFTCSRGSIICGVVTYLASYTVSLFHSRRARTNAAIHIVTALIFLTIFLVFRERLGQLFKDLITYGLDPFERDIGYREGWKQFLKNPSFGSTFYPNDYYLYTWATSEDFVSFFPPRWHNTIIQILASCGIVGILAYLYHRFQTLMLFLRRFSGKKMFVLVSMATLLVASMVDNHFFNIGPVLFYSAMLAFTEKRLN